MKEKGRSGKHWIYVVGSDEFRERANAWAERKTRQGKIYMVIDTASGQTPLSTVADDDVLYVYGGDVVDGRFGEEKLSPVDLAERLEAQGLSSGHRLIKLFASRSGDESPCFAEQFLQAMRVNFPQVAVHGYKGHVDPEGFDGHKSGGMKEGQKPDDFSREEWLEGGRRAQENRVEFS